MTDQTGDLSGDFLEPLEDAIGRAERLEKTLANLMSVMKTRGLVFSDSPTHDMQALREKLDTTRQGAQKASGKLQQLQKLVDTSALLTSSLELDRVLEQVMDTVITLTRAQRA